MRTVNFQYDVESEVWSEDEGGYIDVTTELACEVIIHPAEPDTGLSENAEIVSITDDDGAEVAVDKWHEARICEKAFE